MDLRDFNFLNVDYKWKLHSFKITDFDIVSHKTFYLNHGGEIPYEPS